MGAILIIFSTIAPINIKKVQIVDSTKLVIINQNVDHLLIYFSKNYNDMIKQKNQKNYFHKKKKRIEVHGIQTMMSEEIKRLGS